MNLPKLLAQFDGRHVKSLEDLGHQLLNVDNAVDDLIVQSHHENPHIQTAATWLLKWLQEHGKTIGPSQQALLLERLPDASGWEAKLHLLQMLEPMRLTTSQAQRLWKILIPMVSHEQKLIRAWAYSGLFVVAQQHTRYRRLAVKRLSAAQQDEAASVKARIRQIQKKAKWLSLESPDEDRP